MTSQNRKLIQLLKHRLAEKAPLIQVVLGPRQVGKTTALLGALQRKAELQNADYPTPLPSSVIEEWWHKALASPAKILAIDEVQKILGWTEVLKKLWDGSADSRPLKVIVTGSSALLVEKGLKETLAGRYELIRAEHWNYQEAKDVFKLSLRTFIEFGCYPGSIPLLRQDIARWGQYFRDSIVDPALGRDLLQLHPVEHPALLRQLFGISVSLPAQVVSLQKLQGQLQGKGTLPTLQHYLKLLGDAFLISGIDKYSPSGLRAKKSSPKLIVHDNALLRAFTRPIGEKISSEMQGRYFENCIGARFIEAGWDTYYWKDRDLEVDFVVIGPQNEKWAVEVKSAPASETELRGLKKFISLFPEFKPFLISLTGQKFPGVENLSAETVLSLSRNC